MLCLLIPKKAGALIPALGLIQGLIRLLNENIGRCVRIRAQHRAAGVGVAMGNAAPEVKAAADMVTDDNEHSGVAKVIRKIL